MGIRQAELSDSRIVAAVAFVCSAAFLAATAAVTVVLAGGGSESLRWPFRILCHGQIDRAFEIMGTAMPLCARCFGIYGGIALAAVGLFVRFPERRTPFLFGLGTMLVAPVVIDGAFQVLGLWSTGNLARAVTGLAFGVGVVLLAGNGLAPRVPLKWESPTSSRPSAASGGISQGATQ